MSSKAKIIEFLGENYKKSDDLLINLFLDTERFYIRLKNELKDSDLMMEYTNKVGAKNVVKNPLAVEYTKTVQTMNLLLRSLGLTPAQRKEITTGEADATEDV